MLDYLIFAGVSAAFLIILVIYLYPGSKKKTTIPGPDPSDVQEGNLPDVVKAGSLHQYLQNLHLTYGNISGFYWGEQFVVSIADPKYFEAQIGVFDKSKDLAQIYNPLISGNALQLTNGVPGRKRHKLLSTFLDGKMCDNVQQNVLEVGWNLNKRWRTYSKNDHVPVNEYMSALTFKALANICFGKDISDKQIHDLKQQFDIVWNGMESNLLSGDLKKKESVDKAFAKLKKAVLSVAGKKTNGGDDLWSVLINECSQESAAHEILAFISSGYRSVAAWLTWCIYYLACDSDVQTKMRTEVRKNSTTKEEGTTFNMLKLKFTKQVLDECLRCSCVVPWTNRVQSFDTQISGHLIPKDTPVIQALGAVCQNEDIFDDPECFLPERMDEEKVKSLPPFSFSPFGFAGKRACPAINVSYMMATAWIAQIVSSFKFKLVGEEQSCPAAFGLVTRPEEEVWIGLAPVN